MSTRLRLEQCCAEEGCMRPARYGSLCAACLMAATPARRAVEMMAMDAAVDGPGLVDREGEMFLRGMFATSST